MIDFEKGRITASPTIELNTNITLNNTFEMNSNIFCVFFIMKKEVKCQFLGCISYILALLPFSTEVWLSVLARLFLPELSTMGELCCPWHPPLPPVLVG